MSLASQGSGEYLDREELTELETLVGVASVRLADHRGPGNGSLAARPRPTTCVSWVRTPVPRVSLGPSTMRRRQPGANGWQTHRLLLLGPPTRDVQTGDNRRANPPLIAQNRFGPRAGSSSFIIYGYIKPPGAKNDGRTCRRNPLGRTGLSAMVSGLLEEGASYAEVADWLQPGKASSPVPMARADHWNDSRVATRPRSQPDPQGNPASATRR